MKKPEPKPGLVIRYDYLWRDEAIRGRQAGAKDRPCAIVVTLQERDSNDIRVLLAPITHSPPDNPDTAIEIPAKVKQHLGLDQARSWIIATELNSVAWADAGIIPASRSRWDYGFLPAKLFMTLLERIREFERNRTLNLVDRTEEKTPDEPSDRIGRAF